MEKLPEEISNKADDIPSHGLQNAEEENSRDRRQELAKGLLINKYCRICREPGDHWTVHCPNQDKAKQKLPKNVSDATKKLVPEVSGDIPYSGQATIAGGGVRFSCPSKPKPNFSGETKSRLARDKEELSMEMLEISDDVPYPGIRVPQPQGTVTLRQVLEITDALEKENCRNWQILTKKQEECSKCGLKMGKDCIHFDENGTYKLPNCIFCNTHGDHWSYDCPKYEPETFWAVCEQTGRIPWTLYKEN